ncbi:hypothetical protein AVEN_106716-1 [Araneus ventricosus]|uniref:Uncharacterized protein n=1 Tax=Araneus ventricosus TaxID=182803 RepID=A0A4Y2F130_ARAVE|nr:hypothetical protein AVEN_106716-1 [Araneus ventricosus]
MDQHQYRSASNSLLARTADRSPKTFALQGDPSRSTFLRHSSALLTSSHPAGHDVTWNHLVHSSVSPALIEKIPASLKSHISLPRWSPRSGDQTWLLPVVPYLPL